MTADFGSGGGSRGGGSGFFKRAWSSGSPLESQLNLREHVEELEEERRLCYVGMTRARSRLVLTGAARRRVFGEYQSTEPSRFIGEIPPELMKVLTPSWSAPSQGTFAHSHYEFRTNPYGRRGRRQDRWREEQPAAQSSYAYEDEDQSSPTSVRLGMRVRHPQFGVGTVIGLYVAWIAVG